MKERIKHILISPKTSIREAMHIIQAAPHKKEPAPSGIAIVVDKEHHLLGVVTDGDIRRAILNNTSIDEKVEKIMKKNPVTVGSHLSALDMMHEITNEIKVRNTPGHKLEKVLVVHSDNKVHDIVSFFDLWKNTEVTAKNIHVVGLGYVGLTLALSLADVGFRVCGIDANEEVVKSLNKGKPHFHEVGLETLLKHHVGNNFFVKKDIDNDSKSGIYIIAVNTPVGKDKKVELKYLKNALESVGKALKPHDLVILRSTVPIGTCRNVAVPVLEKSSGLKAGSEFYLSFAPERTIEGKALQELRTLPQVIGGIDKESVNIATRLFKTLTNFIVPVESLESAEMVKLLNNTFRDVSFAYANEIAQLCEAFSLNTFEVIGAANNGYPRNQIPTPSTGVGGACLTKDPYILAASAEAVGKTVQLPIIGRDININMIDYVSNKVLSFLSKNKKTKAKIFVIGMAFKGWPETSDLRWSTSVDIIEKLSKKHKIEVFDAVISKDQLKKEGYTPVSLQEGFKNADAVLILNNHPSFRNIDLYTLLETMKKPGIFFDGWNMVNEESVLNVEGITYATLGK